MGSVGTRDYIVLLQGNYVGDRLLLQVKEALPSVVQDRGLVRHRHHGQQVVDGQRTDPVGQRSVPRVDECRLPPFFVRQLRDMKDSVDPKRLRGAALRDYAETCGAILAKAHARTGYPSVIASYCGNSENFDLQMAAFARGLRGPGRAGPRRAGRAVKAGTLAAEPGV